ncbi:MAG: aspartate aminotransferase family protein [Gemmatimonadaceae bacterium]
MSATSLENAYLGMSETPAVQVRRAKGDFVYDRRGKKYIDFVMGWCVGNFGWGNPQIVAAAERYDGPDYVYPEYSYAPWGELARLLASISPGNLTRSFRATGGSEAVELAIQAAMLHTGRKKFVALEDSYHGNTIGAMSIASKENRDKLSNLLPYCHRIPTPLDDHALDRLQSVLKGRDVAAFIMEPVAMNLGVLIPGKSFMTEVQQLCRRYGTLLVMDEVACGFCRTGKVFASEHFDVEPDIMTMGKAITGGVAGMGATIMTEEVADSLSEDGNIWSTFGWHPRAVDVAIATVKYVKRSRRELLRHAAELSEYFRTSLSSMSFRGYSAVNILGLAIYLNVGDEDYAEEIRKKCQRKGLLLVTQDDGLLLIPAVTVDREVAARAMDILADSAA